MHLERTRNEHLCRLIDDKSRKNATFSNSISSHAGCMHLYTNIYFLIGDCLWLTRSYNFAGPIILIADKSQKNARAPIQLAPMQGAGTSTFWSVFFLWLTRSYKYARPIILFAVLCICTQRAQKEQMMPRNASDTQRKRPHSWSMSHASNHRRSARISAIPASVRNDEIVSSHSMVKILGELPRNTEGFLERVSEILYLNISATALISASVTWPYLCCPLREQWGRSFASVIMQIAVPWV